MDEEEVDLGNKKSRVRKLNFIPVLSALLSLEQQSVNCLYKRDQVV